MPALAENTADNTVENPERPATPATHAVSTPIWDREGRKFRKWLKLGDVWCGPTGNSLVSMPMMPIDSQRSFTGYLRLVPVGQKPPAPLTMTQEEFIEDMAAAEHDLGVEP